MYGLVILSCIIPGCCEEEYTITSVGNMQAYKLFGDGGTDRVPIITVTGDFILGIYFEERMSGLNTVSFINSSYAHSCKETRLNAIENASLNLSLDKEFVLNGDTVMAHTNLLDIENSGIERRSLVNGMVEFQFTNSFFSNATLENGDYLFSFDGMTDDDVHLTSELTLELIL